MGGKIEQSDTVLVRRYRRLHQYTGEIVLSLTEDGVIQECNERVSFYFPNPITGKKIESLFEGIDFPISSLCETEVVQNVFARATLSSGKKYNFLLLFIPIADVPHNREIMVIGKDMTDIESCKEEVESLRERIDELEHERRVIDIGKDKTSALTNALRKLERTKGELEKTNQTLMKELELAATLQKSLVPHRPPEDSYLRFAFHYEPMQFVGGDYYDVMNLGEGKTGIIIADVSGHGVSSAFIAAMLKISFLNYGNRFSSPAKVLSKLNAEYCDVIQTGDYVTIFYAVIDPPNNTLTYCGAGHPRPLFLHRKTKSIELLSSEGFFIGMFDQAEYTDKVVEMHRGDRLMVFTDGVIEAYSDDRGEQFGDKRLLECFKEYRDEPIDCMIAALIERVKVFMKKSIFYDDLAIVAVEYKRR